MLLEGLTQPGWPKYRKEGGLCRRCLPVGRGELFQIQDDFMWQICSSSNTPFPPNALHPYIQQMALASFTISPKANAWRSSLKKGDKNLKTHLMLDKWVTVACLQSASQLEIISCLFLYPCLAWVPFSCSLAVWGNSCLGTVIPVSVKQGTTGRINSMGSPASVFVSPDAELGCRM